MSLASETSDLQQQHGRCGALGCVSQAHRSEGPRPDPASPGVWLSWLVVAFSVHTHRVRGILRGTSFRSLQKGCWSSARRCGGRALPATSVLRVGGPFQSRGPGQSPMVQGPILGGSKLPVLSQDLREQRAHVSVTGGHMKLCQFSHLLPGPHVCGKDGALNLEGLAAWFCQRMGHCLQNRHT